MALSETMSSPNEWVQYYQPNSFSGQVANPDHASSGAVPGGGVAEATAVTTTATAGTLPSPVGSGSSNSSPLNPEGRVSKPIRRRSRASRRTPTTLLNTDTTNFRAMVQQFTGGPTAPFGSGSSAHGGPLSINFGLGSGQSHLGHGGFMVHHPSASPGGFHLQYPMQQQQQQQQQSQNHPQYMLSLNTTSPVVPAGDGFLQRLGNININPRGSNNTNMQGVMGSDHLDGVSSSGLQMPPRPSSSPNDNNFLFH